MAKSPAESVEETEARMTEPVPAADDAPAAAGAAGTGAAPAAAETASDPAVAVNASTTAVGAVEAAGAVESVQPSASLTRARAIAKLAADSQATDVMILDLRKRTALFDFFIVATGKSGRQLRAIADEVDDLLQKQLGEKRLHIDGYQDSRWIVLDYGDLVIHLFDREMRDFYRIEDLWSDAPRVSLS